MSLTVGQARQLVGLPDTDARFDERLRQLIDAAYEQAAEYVGPLQATTVTETLHCAPGGRLMLQARPVTQLLTINGAPAPEGLRIDPRIGSVTGAIGLGSVTITYLSGHRTVPAAVEEGVRSWVLHRWRQEAHGSATFGDDQAETPAGLADFEGLPNAVRNAWRPYLLPDWGFA